MKKASLIVLLSALFPLAAFAQVDFIIEYEDAQGYGFYDTTPVSPIGGNTGTTFGEQRRIAFEKAIETYEHSFTSNIPIHVQAHFANNGGTTYSAVLASAGPEWFLFNFRNAPLQNIAYPSALANKISGLDLSDSSQGIADIDVEINVDVDGAALGSSSFYYGLDGQSDYYDLDSMTVISHELMHGLGFLSVIDPTTGHKFGCGSGCSRNDIGDVFSTQLARVVDNTPIPLLSMSQSDRRAAATATGEVVWAGSIAEPVAQTLFNGTNQGYPLIYTPSPAEYGSSLSHTAFEINPTAIMQPAYSGALETSAINLAMLADIGWGAQVADLEVHLFESNDGSGLFTAIVSNNSSSTINQVTLDLSTNNGNIVPATSSNCSVSGTRTTCTLGSLGSEQLMSFDFNVTGYSGLAEISATLDADIVELNANNNIAVGYVSASSESSSGTSDTSERSLNTGQSESSTSTTQTSEPRVITESGGGSLNIAFLVALLLMLGVKQHKAAYALALSRNSKNLIK
ncbi:MAG TPA: hypothetical protein DHW71_12020 [Gammaproteobacteria bacterium]|nr:hypothetical protein [Gammaproteobacteria bacterium]